MSGTGQADNMTAPHSSARTADKHRAAQEAAYVVGPYGAVPADIAERIARAMVALAGQGRAHPPGHRPRGDRDDGQQAGRRGQTAHHEEANGKRPDRENGQGAKRSDGHDVAPT